MDLTFHINICKNKILQPINCIYVCMYVRMYVFIFICIFVCLNFKLDNICILSRVEKMISSLQKVASKYIYVNVDNFVCNIFMNYYLS